MNLTDTQLEYFFVNFLEADRLDISRNKLKRITVTLLSETLNQLTYFQAAEKEFEISAEIIEHLRSNLHKLDSSGSYVRKLNETAFKHMKFLQNFILQNTHLLISYFKPFEIHIYISNNNLRKLNYFYST